MATSIVVGVVGAKELLSFVGELAKAPREELCGLRPVPLTPCDLDPENVLQPPPERRGDPHIFVQALDPAFELGGRDVAAL